MSATADYGMLAHLTYAYGQENKPLEATVVDRCETALLLNRWYADRYKIALTTACGDLLEYRADYPFDMVCTHNLLGRFDSESRRRLVAHWHTLLRSGGVVVTTQRIRPNNRDDRTVFVDEQARRLSEHVVATARDHPQRLDIDPDELARTVFEYAIRKWGYVMRTSRELTELFEAAGFDISLSDKGGGISERNRDLPSSPAGKDTYRMRIIARKR
jgi:SAM-dependent methyltransferase